MLKLKCKNIKFNANYVDLLGFLWNNCIYMEIRGHT